MNNFSLQSFGRSTVNRFVLAVLTMASSLLLLQPVSAQETKVPVKPVEPFYQEVSAELPKIYQPKVTYLSPEKTAPIVFSSLGATWKQTLPAGTSILLEVRFKNNGKYSDWYTLEPSIDQMGDDASATTGPQDADSFITTSQADGYQYRIALNSSVATTTPVLDDLKFTFINGGSPQQKTDLMLASHSYRSSTTSDSDPEFMPADFDASTLVASNDPNPALNPSDLVASANLVAAAEPVTVIPGAQPKVVKVPVRPKTTNINNVVPTSQPSPGSSNITDSKLNIISRSNWGADETIRLFKSADPNKKPVLISFAADYYTKYAAELKESKSVTTDASGNLLTWPLSYPQSIKKIVIHHTATTKDLDDPKKAIRDIYVWHTLSKGWGDIGYNYIIDPQGNIYEGRYGGEMVVGAHAGPGNFGSIGIAVLGNYQENNPPEAVISSLAALIKEKATIYKIDTEGASLFRGQNYPNVMGHRDIMSTSCPGDKLYAMLPIIRKLAKASTTTTGSATLSKDYDFTWGANTPVFSLTPKAKKTVTLTVKNTGTKAWPATTYFQVHSDVSSQTFLKNSEKILTSTVGKEIKPGQTATLQVMLIASSTSGTTLIDLMPVIGGTNSVQRYLSFALQVQTPAPKPKYDYELLSVIYNKTTFQKGDTVAVTVKLRNKGTAPWQNSGNNKVMLGADKPQDHLNTLLTTPSSRLATMNEKLVQSGQIATFTFQIKVPNKDGLYKEYFTPVVEGIQWMNNHSSFVQVRVGSSTTAPSDSLDDSDSNDSSTSPTTTSPTTTTPTPPVVTNSSGGSSTNIATAKLDLTTKPRAIRVDLAYRGNPATISASANFALYEGVKKISDFSANQKVVVTYQNSQFIITSGSSKWILGSKAHFVPASGSILRIDNWQRGGSSNGSYDNQFRGALDVVFYNNELHVINELALEDYIKGISEEPSTEPDEKIKTIMVIARTYARFYMDVAKKFPGAPFDLTDDPSNSQKYTGYTFEQRSPKTVGFATATAGQYVTYGGKLIKTPFFSRSDGKKTISAKDKWGWTDAPFLLSVDDSLCKSTAFAGHGVGLSGCGATAMAQLGKTYKEIISYYYTGTTVSQAAY